MKDLVKYGAQHWNLMTEQDKDPYKLLAEIDRIRYERDKLNFEQGGISIRDPELGSMQA